MTVHAVQCRSCGGAIAHETGSVMPRCLFCGRDALEERDLDEAASPEVFLPFATSEAEARAAFKQWARSRFWAPRSIRRATVKLSQLFLPAWMWSGELETHWAALIPAATRSGKRPLTGQERGHVERVMVPSSPTLSQGELAELAPFPAGNARPLGDGGPPGPYEVGLLTREVA
ncbi:MAG: hypothetical protein KDA24_09340, partial [Deltaproteobacteria bacterium]|nr:hypothetical protein [Deltaproteobacteria bacterium]